MAFETVLQHFYKSAGADVDIPLFTGRFALDSKECRGNISFTWRPVPHVTASGGRDEADFDSFNLSEEIWVPRSQVSLFGSEVPLQPDVLPDLPEWSESFDDIRMDDCFVGESCEVDRVTFLLPNGWRADDAHLIWSDVNDGSRWRGRLDVQPGEWRITLDLKEEWDTEAWRKLRRTGGYAITHVGQLRRADGKRFSREDAERVLRALDMLISLALGRKVSTLHPVGWVDMDAKWAVWTNGLGVDLFRGVSTWTDDTEATDQIGNLIFNGLPKMLNSGRTRALDFAIEYYVTANHGMPVEAGTSLAVSALQMLSYDRLVDGKKLSHNSWKDLNADGQIKSLLSLCGVPCAAPSLFRKLQGVPSKLSLNEDGTLRDVVSSIVKMRNYVVHPNREQTDKFDFEEWAEAFALAQEFLALAILNSLGYTSSYHPEGESTWAGDTKVVPWVGTASKV